MTAHRYPRWKLWWIVVPISVLVGVTIGLRIKPTTTKCAQAILLAAHKGGR
jgi:hypothetical protein